MVIICDKPYPKDNDIKYQDYFDMFISSSQLHTDLRWSNLSDFQKYAIEGIIEKNHILICAPTGSGKTLPAEFAIQYFHSKNKKVIYTSPIKALSNQKYYEFTKKYDNISFGLLTGDIKTNPEADVLIMTTEILMNYLFLNNGNQKTNLNFTIDLEKELGCVIIDEIHYINNEERGKNYEKTILMLPQNIQIIGLSATLENPQGFAEWIENRSKDNNDAKCLISDALQSSPNENDIEQHILSPKNVWLAITNHRIVPLSHYGFLTTTEAIFKTIKDKDIQKQIRDNTNVLLDMQDHKGIFKDSVHNTIIKYTKLFEQNQIFIKKKHVLNQLSLFLRDREMLPAIAFVFSRKNVEKFAKDITVSLLEDDSKVPYIVRRECEQIIRKLPNFTEYLQLPEYNELVSLLEKGIGIHHSGMIPVLREIVELMISKRYIKLLFATESFAIGLDCPIKTTVFTSLTKFDGNNERYLMAHEYTQMAGRAGRRGIDTVGYVVHCNNLFKTPTITEYKTILGGVPQKLVSKFHISYDLILNLIKNGINQDFSKFCKKSMINNDIYKITILQNSKIYDLEQSILRKKDSLKFSRTPIQICKEYMELEEKHKSCVNKKRKECERSIQTLLDDYKFILQDLKPIRELLYLEEQLKIEKQVLMQNETFINTHIEMVCKILVEEGFIVKIDNNFETTNLGKIASNIAEVHPLIMAKTFNEILKSSSITTVQIISLLSCFTDIKVPTDLKLSIPNVKDNCLEKIINSMIYLSNKYEDLERDLNIQTGIHYNDLMMYDMIDYSIKWCDCETEIDCKYFIQNIISEKEISIGDFTKAMMKIVTMSRELENICEELQEVEMLHKLRQIESKVLKYVLTSQSLYV